MRMRIKCCRIIIRGPAARNLFNWRTHTVRVFARTCQEPVCTTAPSSLSTNRDNRHQIKYTDTMNILYFICPCSGVYPVPYPTINQSSNHAARLSHLYTHSLCITRFVLVRMAPAVNPNLKQNPLPNRYVSPLMLTNTSPNYAPALMASSDSGYIVFVLSFSVLSPIRYNAAYN